MWKRHKQKIKYRTTNNDNDCILYTTDCTENNAQKSSKYVYSKLVFVQQK